MPHPLVDNAICSKIDLGCRAASNIQHYLTNTQHKYARKITWPTIFRYLCCVMIVTTWHDFSDHAQA